ncbi:MAG: hypothetical protein IKZ82_10185 [Clostridia bacterium]|nr:hypothetical protein [Clostridia bacterium]
MKKALSLVLAALMLFAFAAVPKPAFASTAKASSTDHAEFSLSAAPAQLKVGETVNIEVSIHGTYEFSALRLMLVFDSSIFEYNSYELGAVSIAAAASGAYISASLAGAGTHVNFGIAAPIVGVSAEGVLFTASFTAKADAQNGSYAFTPVISKPNDFAHLPMGEMIAVPISHTETGISVVIIDELSVELTAPTVVQAVITDGKPVITWNAVVGAAGYKIYRAPKGGSYSLIGTAANTSYTDNGSLTPGAKYYYKVCAVDAADNNGPLSAYVSVTAPNTVTLTAPTVVSAVVTNGRPVVSWNAVNGAAGYNIYRAPKGGSYSLIGTSTSLSYTDNGSLTPGTKYYYKVAAVSANGTVGPMSGYASVVAPEAPVSLPAPSGISAVVTSGIPVVSWNAVNGAASYNIYRAAKGGSYSLIGTSTSLSFTDASSLSAGSYYYKIAGVDSSGNEGELSEFVRVMLL